MIESVKDILLQVSVTFLLLFLYEIFFSERNANRRGSKAMLFVLMAVSILFCMTFPAYMGDGIRLDIRVVPLLIGALYGGMPAGLLLAGVIVLYRMSFGIETGVYTTVLTLLFSMPIILYIQRRFGRVHKRGKVQIALFLAVLYCAAGIGASILFRGISLEVIFVQMIYLGITALSVLFFIYLKETMKEMFILNHQLQSEVKDMEIGFLRAQMKPHFLNNALSSIAELCMVEPYKAEKLTVELSQYLRSSLAFKQLDALTTIDQEMKLVHAYLNIEKARFGSRLNVEYDIDVNLEELVPPLILQPLVENAVGHGLMSNLNGGTVKITVKKAEPASISVAVEDNGCGISERKRQALLEPAQSGQQRKGIGLWNINRRFQLLYGKSLRIESVEGRGTRVSFDIPVGSSKQIGG